MLTRYESISGGVDDARDWTFATFRDRRRDAYLAENPGLTKATYDLNTPDEWVMAEWVDALHDVAHNGGTIHAAVLDDLYRRQKDELWSLRHDHERAFPIGYLNPDARDRNRAEAREMAAARRRGRGRYA